MEKAWNKEHKYFGQSYDENGTLDSAVLIMPLVFFMQAVRLSSTNIRDLADSMYISQTLWSIEALTRAGTYDKSMLRKAVTMFEVGFPKFPFQIPHDSV